MLMGTGERPGCSGGNRASIWAGGEGERPAPGFLGEREKDKEKEKEKERKKKNREKEREHNKKTEVKNSSRIDKNSASSGGCQVMWLPGQVVRCFLLTRMWVL